MPNLEAIGGVLKAVDSSGNSFFVAVAYPQSTLTALAQTLANELHAVSSADYALDPLTKKIPDTIEIIERTHEVPDQVVLEQPEESDAVLSTHESGIKIDVPPSKDRTGIGFAIVWLGISTIVAVGALLGDAENAATLPFVGLFIAIGVGILLWSIDVSRRKTSLVTSGDQLLVVSDSLFGTRRQIWSKQQLNEIRCGASNVSQDDRSLPELQVHDRNRKFGCLINRDEDELKWIAAKLTSALNLAPLSDDDSPLITEVNRNNQGESATASRFFD